MWHLTNDDLAYFKRIGNCEGISDEYARDMLPLLLAHVNEECVNVSFAPPNLPANVTLFLAQSLAYFSAMQPGLESESVSGVSFNYDFSQLPKGISDLLKAYGYGIKRGYVRFRPF